MYFKSFASISPSGILKPGVPLNRNTPLTVSPATCREPEYGPWISPMQLRRMSKPVRLGLATAKICLEKSAALPDSIHIGSAFGMLADSEIYLKNMIEREESMLTPTSFIQSTHNTVGGQIALALKCNAYNMTFVHGGHSFESAVLDTELMLFQSSGKQALLGAVEETTPTSFEILSRFGLYKEHVVSGEGAAFFLVSGKRDQNTLGQLLAFDLVLSEPSDKPVFEVFSEFRERNRLIIEPRDFCLIGAGDQQRYEHAYLPLVSLFSEDNTIEFKAYCGEYPTAAAFALSLALDLQQQNPAGKTWIINNYGKYWSFWCVSS